MPKDLKYNVSTFDGTAFDAVQQLATSDNFNVKNPCAMVRNFIEKKNINITNCNGVNLLMEAMAATESGKAKSESHLAIVDLLKNYCTDQEISDAEKYASRAMDRRDAATEPEAPAAPQKTLHSAAKDDDVTAINTILDAGADINGKDTDGYTAIQIAVLNASMNALARLLELGADREGLDGVALLAEQEVIDYLIKEKILDAASLMYDVAEKDVESAVGKVLVHLEGGVDVLLDDKLNALHVASEKGSTKVISKLLEAGANIEAESGIPWTAIQHGVAHGQREVFKALHEANANLGVKDKKTGNNLAHIAAATNGISIIHDVLEVRGVLAGEPNNDGDLPSHVAAALHHDFVVEEILRVAPEVVDAMNGQGLTMKDLVPADHPRFSELLKDAHTGKELRELEEAEAVAQEAAEAAAQAAEPEPEKLATPTKAKAKRAVSFYDNLDADPHTPTGLRAAASALRKATTETVLKNPYTPSAASGMLRSLVDAIKDNKAARVGEILTDNEYLKDVKLKICGNNQIGQDQSKKIEGDLISLTLLHLAAYFGSTGVARYLIETLEMKPNATASFEGYTPLHLAAKANHTECATYLSTKCLVNTQTEHTGYTASHYAVDNNNAPLVRALAPNSDLSLLTQRDQENPLDTAAYFGRSEIFKILMQQTFAKENISKTTLRKAIKGSSQFKDAGHSDIVCKMVAMKPEIVNYYYGPKSMNSVMEALGSNLNFKAISDIFKASGEMILRPDKDGLNVLHYAVKYGSSAFVTYLKFQKPDHFKALMQAPDKEGNLPIHYVTKYHQCYDSLKVLDEVYTQEAVKSWGGLKTTVKDRVTHLTKVENKAGQTVFGIAKLHNDSHAHNSDLLGFARELHDGFVQWEETHPFVEAAGAHGVHGDVV